MRPFSCGSEFQDWQTPNCERCAKSRMDMSGCQIELAMMNACFGDGEITDEIAERAGTNQSLGNGAIVLGWPCKEFVQAEPGTHWREIEAAKAKEARQKAWKALPRSERIKRLFQHNKQVFISRLCYRYPTRWIYKLGQVWVWYWDFRKHGAYGSDPWGHKDALSVAWHINIKI